jgi:glycosyltransferase involved in cell wall biosynthesis
MAGRDLEIVVVDDALSDATAEICRSIAAINYVRVDRNQGVAGARNIGVVASSGAYLSFLDDDDVRLPGSIDQQIEILDQTPAAALVYAQAIPEDSDGSRRPAYPADCLQGDLLWELLIRNFIPAGSVVFRRSCLSKVGLLDESIPGTDDWDLWIRIAEVFPIVALETPVMIWPTASSRPWPTANRLSPRQSAACRTCLERTRVCWFHLAMRARWRMLCCGSQKTMSCFNRWVALPARGTKSSFHRQQYSL